MEHPSTVIENNGLKLTIFLPDAQKGFYRSVRFDWSGMIATAEYFGHKYFGPWRTPHDPEIYENGIGPAEEFGLEEDPPLFAEAAQGETFVKIGVGLLKKTKDQYDFREHFPIVEAGTWTVREEPGSIEFEQLLTYEGVGYRYWKRIEVSAEQKGTFTVAHLLENTGSLTLRTSHYNHAFIRIDDLPIDSEYEVHLPFDSGAHGITIEHGGYAEVRNKVITFVKQVDEGVRLWTPLSNWSSDNIAHSQFSVVNRAAGVGIKMTLDKPPSKFNFYAEVTAACPEPFIRVELEPGDKMEWTNIWTMGSLTEVLA